MNDQTLQQMKQLRLYGMHRAFTTTLEANHLAYTNDELVAYLLQSEWDDKHNRKIERLTKAAKFRYKASVEEISFESSRMIDKNLLIRFTSCEFIKTRKTYSLQEAQVLVKALLPQLLDTKLVL
nr:ATP-binding protein [Galbibacter orientalis]